MPNGSFDDDLFSPGSSIQIEFRDDFHVKNVFKSHIEKNTEENLTLLLPDEIISPIKPKTKLIVISHATPQNYFFMADVLEYIPGNPPSLIISKPVTVQSTSRRNFFRCDVELPLLYQDKSGELKPGKVINLSASGLYAIIEHNHILKTGKIISCEMILPIFVEPLRFDGKITRLEKTENKYNQGIGISFLSTNEKFQNHIIKYLFQRQRELIKSGHIKVGRI